MPEKDIFGFQRNCLRYVGHQFDENDLNEKSSPVWWRRIVQIVSVLLVCSAQLPMMNYFVYNINDLELTTDCVSIVITNLLTIIKIITFFRHKADFNRLMVNLNAMYRMMNLPPAKEILRRRNRESMKVVLAYYYSCTLTGLYFHCDPLVRILWARFQGRDSEFHLPMPMRFPFDYHHSPGYQFAYCYTFLITCGVILYASAVDSLFLSFAYNLRGHFECLQLFIRSNTYEASHSDQHRSIRSYIQYHSNILDMSNQLAAMYRSIVFAEFMLVSLLFCVILYQMMSNVTSIFLVITYGTFLSASLLQLLIYCYGGEILRSESSMIATAIQLSNWYNLTPSNRRLFLFIMRRSQKAVIIKAGFYVASLENFMKILKAALSYITLMQSIE